jgi:hypothetical protein
MVAGYMQGYTRAGISMSLRDVEKQVLADCDLVDNARKAGDLAAPGAKPNKKKERKARPDPLLAAQRETGLDLRVNEKRQVVRSKTFNANPMLTSERWGAAAARIKRILEGVRKDTSSLVVAVEDAELGVLATQYADLWGHFMTRYQAPPLSGNDRNPFRGMNDRDSARKFQRLVEDICDRSTSRLGAWFNGVSATGFARNK